MTEYELERMVVRLMGDSRDYRNMLQTAVNETASAVKKIQNTEVQAATQNKLLQEAGRLSQSAAGPVRQYQQEIVELTGHLRAGRIDQQTFNYHLTQSKRAFEQANSGITPLVSSLGKLGGILTVV